MALQGQNGIGRTHARSVVAHADELFAAVFDVDSDAARSGVEGVFDQFLDRVGRTFDDFARRDLVGDERVEFADALVHNEERQFAGTMLRWV